MKKYAIIFLIFLWIGNNASAQNAMAKLKYEDAETSYARKDFKSALASLKEAEELLKSTNPKLLHLKILIMSSMVNTLLDFRFDPEYVAEVKKDCAYYLKTYENVPNNEDKYREVYEVAKSINSHNKFGKMLINAQNGDDKSQDSLGRIYDNRQRTDRSTYWFNKAIAAGNTSAMNNMGIAAEYTEKDKAKAIKYYEMSASKGNVIGMTFLAFVYDADKNEKAVYWYNKAADAGHLSATAKVGGYYFRGDLVAQSDSKALAYYNKAIILTPKSEHDTLVFAGCYLNLINLHYFGDNMPKDYKKVEDYAKKANSLESSNAETKDFYAETKALIHSAQTHLGNIYRTGGYGIQQNYEAAFTFYSMAVKAQEDGQTYYGLALLYKDGLGVKKDKSKAQEYTQKAIELLNKESENNRGNLVTLEELYRNGVLVNADPKKADEYKAKIDAILAKKSKNH